MIQANNPSLSTSSLSSSSYCCTSRRREDASYNGGSSSDNKNNNDDDDCCNRRISRAARYILQEHLYDAIRFVEQILIEQQQQQQQQQQPQSRKKQKKKTTTTEIARGKQTFWDVRQNIISSLLDNIDLEYSNEDSNKSTNTQQKSRRRSSSTSRNTCSLLFGNDIFEHDENDIIVKLFDRRGMVYNAIPGQRAKPPHRKAHQYRNKQNIHPSKISTTKLSLSGTKLVTPYEQLLFYQRGVVRNKQSLDRIYQPPWYQSISSNKTFVSQYYLDFYYDKKNPFCYKQTTGQDEDQNKNQKLHHDNNLMICPSKDWCGIIIPYHTCYDTALFLEPYYENDSYRSKKTDTHRPVTNIKDIYEKRMKIKRSYQKEADRLASQCTIESMKQIQLNCRTMITNCFGTDDDDNDNENDATFLSSKYIRDYLLESLCTNVPTCHNRLYRLLHSNTKESSSNGDEFWDHITSVTNTRDPNEVNYFGWSSILVLLLLIVYYVLYWYYHDPSESKNNPKGPSTVLLLSAGSNSKASKSQQQQQLSSSSLSSNLQKQQSTRSGKINSLSSLQPPIVQDILYHTSTRTPTNNNESNNNRTDPSLLLSSKYTNMNHPQIHNIRKRHH